MRKNAIIFKHKLCTSRVIKNKVYFKQCEMDFDLVKSNVYIGHEFELVVDKLVV